MKSLKELIEEKFKVEPIDIDNYLNFIEKCLAAPREGYGERHHILPKSLFPEFKTGCKWNIKKLTAKDHFLAHYFLFKLFPSHPQMLYAWRMLWVNKYDKLSSKFLEKYAEDYQAAKIKHVANLKGHFVSEETRKKIGDAQKGVARGPMSKETLEKRRDTLSKRTPEEIAHTRERMSISRRNGNWRMSEEHKSKIRQANTGKVRSQESKDKISKANLGKKRSIEVRQKCSEVLRSRVRKPLSTEAKANISRGRLKQIASKKAN